MIKHMEAVVMLGFGLLCAITVASRHLAPPTPVRAAQGDVPAAAPMPVVIITGKRMTAHEKRALDARLG